METSFKKQITSIILVALLCIPINYHPKELDANKNFIKLINNPLNRESINNNSKILKKQILYLFSKNNHLKGLRKYKEYVDTTKEHNYTLLRQISLNIIENAIRDKSEEKSLLALIALEIASEDLFLDCLTDLAKSKFLPVQAKTLSILKFMENEKAERLIESYLSSDFIMLRLQALSILIQKHTKTAIGHVEALMNIVPKNYHPIFVDFYAMCRTEYTISIMKKMLSNNDININIATINAAKNYQIEELIPNIRNQLTHTNPRIQEASATALGSLHDSHSIEGLKHLTKTKHIETRLAAFKALHELGKKKFSDKIKKIAKNKNLFAISNLHTIEDSRQILYELYNSNDNDTRMNTALSLLEMKDPLCLTLIKDLINLDKNSHCLSISYSPGSSFYCYRLTPLSTIPNKQMMEAAKNQTAMLQNQILQKCIDLPVKCFISIIDDIFTQKNNSLVPLAVSLLENLNNKESRNSLIKGSTLVGAPFIRIACHISLSKITENIIHKNYIESWIRSAGKHQIINLSQNKKQLQDNTSSNHELTLEEKSLLLIQSFLAIAKNHDKAGIDCILEAMINGNKKNIIPLAGVLLKTIQ